MLLYSNSSIEWLHHPKDSQVSLRESVLASDKFVLQICRSSKAKGPPSNERPKNSLSGMFRRYLNEVYFTILIEISQHNIEFISKEFAPGRFEIFKARMPVYVFHPVRYYRMIYHVLDLRLIKLIVLETHDTVTNHDTCDVDVLLVSVMLDDLHSNVRNVLACITLSGDLNQ